MRRKIGLYIPTLAGGGAERVVSRLSGILSDTYEIDIILNDHKVEYDTLCKIISLNIPFATNTFSRAFLPFIRARKLKKLKKENSYDCVISFMSSANIVNMLSKTKNVATIVSVRNYSQREKKNAFSSIVFFIDMFAKILYKRSDAVISVSIALEKSLIRDYHVSASKITTIYNPYEISEIAELSLMPFDNKEYENFFNHSKVFVTVGRLLHQKGMWHILKAFSLIDDDNVKLMIIGDGEYRKGIEKLAHELGIERRVLLTGYQKNPFQYMNKSVCYILASLFEGFPNSLVEAMACKCPVIATDCMSGPREILFDNYDSEMVIDKVTYADYGLIIPEMPNEENWDASSIEIGDVLLAEAMNIYLTDKLTWNYYKEKSVTCVKRFDYKSCKEQYMEVIEKYTK